MFSLQSKFVCYNLYADLFLFLFVSNFTDKYPKSNKIRRDYLVNLSFKYKQMFKSKNAKDKSMKVFHILHTSLTLSYYSNSIIISLFIQQLRRT